MRTNSIHASIILATAPASFFPASLAVHAQPGVSITSPPDGTGVSEGSNVAVSASVTDPDGTVTRVDFFDGFNPLGSSTNPPFALTLTNVAAGDYTLLARATDDHGATALSSPVSLSAVPANRPPVVTFDRPFDGAIVGQPINIQLVATANDSDGQVATVEFFADD